MSTALCQMSSVCLFPLPETLALLNPALCLREADIFILRQKKSKALWLLAGFGQWGAAAGGQRERDIFPLTSPEVGCILSRSLDLSRLLPTQLSSSWFWKSLSSLISPCQGLRQLHYLAPCSLSISCSFLTIF